MITTKSAIGLGIVAAVALACVAPEASAQINWDNFDGRLGALAPENLQAERPPAPFDVTGTWMHRGTWQFLRGAEDRLLPRARELYDRSRALAAEGVPFNDFSGQC